MADSRLGVSFRETMSGSFSLGGVDPESGEKVGRAAGTTLSLHATIEIVDVDRFIADPEHMGSLSGSIDFGPLGAALPSTSGIFNLFRPGDDPTLKLMVYEMGFQAGGKDYYLAGEKHVQDGPVQKLWKDTTTLYTRLYEGKDKTGRLVGAGVLSLGVEALVKMCLAMRAVNASSPAEAARAVLDFGRFFMGELWDTYIVKAWGSSEKPVPAPIPAKPGRFSAKRYDAIVIGSGFGGAVIACRLAEKGQKVLVLERGRRWTKASYPRKPTDAWIYDPARPERRNGWMDLRHFKGMSVVQGAAVGGGSLIYANISVEAPPHVFKQGWPPEITYQELKPYYDLVARTMNVSPVPESQIPERTRLMREAAGNIGAADRFQMLPLAVTFDPQWSYGLSDPHDDRHSKKRVNQQGVEQGTCVHCGNCDVGCQVHAKNTLDLNYIPWAEKHGAEVRPLHLARVIRPDGTGYRVDFERVENGRLVPGSESADRVFLAAGSLGSTELLLRCRDRHRTLPKLSGFLGRNWSSNGDFLTPARYKDRKIRPSTGPTITSAIDFLDGSHPGGQFFIEDGGFPDLLGEHLKSGLKKGPWIAPFLTLLRDFKAEADPLLHFMPWFAQGMDAGDGRLTLNRPWYWPFGKGRLHLDWDIRRSESVMNAIVETHQKLAQATGGEPEVPVSWSILKSLVTPHPLGGCSLGATRENGVVDHRGEVFGYPNLFVVDGSIVPGAVGRNPSRTIAALAERTAALVR